MTSMEAYLRLYGYKIVNMSHNVISLSVHDENGQTIVFDDGGEYKIASKMEKGSQLTKFFDLCKQNDKDGELARTLRFDQLPYHFW